jgi:hypothetical protein
MYIAGILHFWEFISAFTFSACSGISIWMLKEEDPLGHILKHERFNIKKEKIIPISIMIIIVGICFLSEVLFSNDRQNNIFLVVGGISCIFFGIIGIFNSKKEIKKDNEDNGVRSQRDRP